MSQEWKLDEYLKSLFRLKESEVHRYHLYSPGKCLLTGGYLILDKGHHGLSLALSAHCHSSVFVKSLKENVVLITVDSPEIKGHWEYRMAEGKELEVLQ